MVSRWLTLILGAAFLQGILTWSPVPVPDDEWEEFARVLRNPAYRLPRTTTPSRYEVELTPYFDITPTVNIRPFSFDGQVTIYITATEANVREIVMHCNDLTINTLTVSLNNVNIGLATNTFECQMPYSFLRIPTNEALQVGQEYVVRATFTGNLQTNMRGFYRSWYRDSTGIRWMGTTQFQPGHARQAFPCYDEPVFKAYFDITINRESGFRPTISNMPIRANQTLPNGRVAETFHTTPLMSTYLIAFIVSHYERVSIGTNPERPFDIYARNNVGTDGDWSLEVGESLMDIMERYTNISYYGMAPNMDMKQAAIPDFSAGAMENWGLATYREALILYDPRNSNHFYKQRVANIIAHEIAHKWFGNLVTCAWWDNLWLNEAFGRFFQYFLAQRGFPDLRYDIRFVVEQVHQAMTSDSVDSAHALTNPDVSDPASVSNHFSVITYAKGASIMRMTEHFLTEDTMMKGLRIFLNARMYDVAEPHHLFESLDAAAAEDGALSQYPGVTIDSYFRTWSERAGHPVLNVNINQRTGEITLTQARWERDTGTSQFPTTWQIPLTWTRGGAPDFVNLKPSQVMTTQNATIQRGTQGVLEWVIFNKQETGFYKVNYDDTNWALLTRALRSNERTVIHELNRAQIVDDLFNFARAGVMSYDRAFNILSFLEFEDAYAPWIAAIDGFNFAVNRLAYNSASLQRLQNEANRLSVAATNRLGYSEIEGESYMDGLLRMYLLTFLCNIGHAQCRAAARQNFASWLTGGFVPANMRPRVYCTGLREGTAADFDIFWNRYLVEDLASEVVVKIQAAGCTSDQASFEKFLDAIVSPNEIIRPQDVSTAWSTAVTGNEANPMRLLDWLRRNLNQVITTLGSAATPISNIAARLRNEAQITEFLAFLEQNRETLGTAYTTGINGVATTRNNLAWSARRVVEFERYFETGYVEDVLEDIVDGTDEEEDDPGSANIATLSIVTLITTVAISLMS